MAIGCCVVVADKKDGYLGGGVGLNVIGHKIRAMLYLGSLDTHEKIKR